MRCLQVQHVEWQLFLLILLVNYSSSGSLEANHCPAPCHCIATKKSTGGQEVSCNGRGLAAMPNFPRDMVSLDMSKNNLTRIPANVFPNFRSLRSLWLDNNKIYHIEAFAFRGIHDYDILSIRGNKELNQLSKYSFSGMRNVRSLILTNNNISLIEKNAFYGSRQIALLAFYGNPLTELRPSILNNLRNVHDIRFPLGITSIIPGAFYGLSHVHELVLEGLKLDNLRTETFFNLTNVIHLTLHDSVIMNISPRAFAGAENISVLTFSYSRLPNLDGDIFEGAQKIPRLVFDKNNLSRVQADFPDSIRQVTHKVIYDTNDADCCSVSVNNLKRWKIMALKSHWVRDFINGVWCATPKWMFDESLFEVDAEQLPLACNGVLDKRLETELSIRQNEKPPLNELYKLKENSGQFLRDNLLLLALTIFILPQFQI